MFANLYCVRADLDKLTHELALDAFGACREAMLRTSPSIGQASSNSLLRHPELLACQSGAAFTSVGSRGCMRLISSAGKHHLHPTSVRALRQKLWLLTPPMPTFSANLLMAVSAPRMLRGWPGLPGKTQPFFVGGHTSRHRCCHWHVAGAISDPGSNPDQILAGPEGFRTFWASPALMAVSPDRLLQLPQIPVWPWFPAMPDAGFEPATSCL